jgi:hypothetical protein
MHYPELLDGFAAGIDRSPAGVKDQQDSIAQD